MTIRVFTPEEVAKILKLPRSTRRAGKSDAWISDRTGQKETGKMIDRYDRGAQTLADLSYEPPFRTSRGRCRSSAGCPKRCPKRGHGRKRRLANRQQFRRLML
jgi:hypothetical protein